MTNRRFLWISLLILIFCSFYFWIPALFPQLSPVPVSFLGGILFVFFLVQSVSDFRTWEEFIIPSPVQNCWRHKIVPYLVIPGLLVIYLFVIAFPGTKQTMLSKYEEKVRGVITQGRVISSGRNSNYIVTVAFRTRDGKLMSVDQNIRKEDAKSFHKGREVEVVYSLNDPNKIELHTEEDGFYFWMQTVEI